MEEEIEESKLKKQRNMYIFDAVLIVIIFAALLFYIFKEDGIENIQNILRMVDYRWVVGGIGCLIGMWVCEAITLQVSLKTMYPKQKIGNSFKITMIGQLFNNITPFASGGQVMQAYVMSKEGKRASDTASALVVKYVITQALLIVFTILVVISQFEFFASIFKDLIWIGIIGIILNVGVVICFFLAGAKKELVMKVCRPLIRFGGKIHIGKFRLVKDPDMRILKLTASVNNFSEQFYKMKNHKKTLFIMAVFGLLQNVFYYAITYMVYKAFGNVGTSFLQVVTAQAFLMLIMTVFPTPGAGGGAEGGFLLLFGEIFTSGINMAILFWRVYVFYLPIIVGICFLIPALKKISKIDKSKRIENK